MYVGGAMIILATVIVTIASHQRESTSLGSVKRQLSFTKLPTMDQDEASSGNGTQGLAHGRHEQKADVQKQCL